MFHDRLSRMPVCLTLPGLDGSGPDHWQSIWERERQGIERVELGSWSQPSRNQWIARLDRAIAEACGPVVLVAHSLSCHLVAWWANLAGEGASRSVAGAMLVAPPDLDRTQIDPRIAAFAPSPRAVLPFPAVVVASRDDPFASYQRQREMAGNWLASFCDAGALGHINERVRHRHVARGAVRARSASRSCLRARRSPLRRSRGARGARADRDGAGLLRRSSTVLKVGRSTAHLTESD